MINNCKIDMEHNEILKLLDLCHQQNMDLIYLMLEINAKRDSLSSEGLRTLMTLRFYGGENGVKYSIEDVDERIKRNIEILEKIKEKLQ